jgi:hypothetical protein
MVIIPIGLLLLVFIFRTFDRLVKAEYETNRNAWEADGRSRGFFWNAPECTFFQSDCARNRLHFFWLFSYSVMGNRVFGVSDLADTLSCLYFGLDHFDRSRICDTDIELKSGYSFCR